MKYKLEDLSITPELLKASGYRKYPCPLADKRSYLESWQKTVYNDYGKAYFINFTFSDISDLAIRNGLDINPYSWEADMQLNSFDDMTVNIKILSSLHDLVSVENFCDRMFKRMNFQNYDYSSDSDEAKHKEELKKESEIIDNTIILNKELPEKTEIKKTKSKKI